jgi:hypothetical protein
MAVLPEQSGGQNSAYRSGCHKYSFNFQRSFMSAPSRRPEIRRRRTRNEKITKLRKRLSVAQSDADKTRITAKLHRMSIGSPGEPLLK